ncbi:MAG: hypothetical protein OEZ10_14380 [Gammaproteobacteria bacterium]|nr:hypothetical protein [Gammaproteobacteria bacterium]
MQQDKQTDIGQLENRVAVLERILATGDSPVTSSTCNPLWPALLLSMACVFAWYGIGIPNHFYQPVFALLVAALLYHREIMTLYDKAWRWLLPTLNLLVLTLFFRLIIGGGEARPFSWLKVPGLEKQAPKPDSSWFDAISPNYEFVWREASTADWSVNITQIQTILLMATLVAGLFRFQPFASIVALVLLLASIPSFLIYDWNWVIPFLIAGSTGLYLQSHPPKR